MGWSLDAWEREKKFSLKIPMWVKLSIKNKNVQIFQERRAWDNCILLLRCIDGPEIILLVSSVSYSSLVGLLRHEMTNSKWWGSAYGETDRGSRKVETQSSIWFALKTLIFLTFRLGMRCDYLIGHICGSIWY